jgi:hypothetical protein
MNSKTIYNSPNNISSGIQIAVIFTLITLLIIVGIIVCLFGTLIFGDSEILSSSTYKLINIGLLSSVAVVSSLLGAFIVKKFFTY